MKVSIGDMLAVLRKKKETKKSLYIHHHPSFQTQMKQLQMRGGHVVTVFVQVKCEGHWVGLCVRNCGATSQSVWRAMAWALDRLNRLAAFLQEWQSAFWANSGMSLRAEDWLCVCGRGASACLCAPFVELSRTRWRGTIFFIRAFWHTDTQMSLADTFLWWSHALWCNYTEDEWAQAGTLHSLWVCVYVMFCVCVSVI